MIIILKIIIPYEQSMECTLSLEEMRPYRFLSYCVYHIVMLSSLPKALLSLLLYSHYAFITILQKPISLRMLLFQLVFIRFYIAFALNIIAFAWTTGIINIYKQLLVL